MGRWMEGGTGVEAKLTCPSPGAPHGASPAALRPSEAAPAARAGRTAARRSRAVAHVPVPCLSRHPKTRWYQSCAWYHPPLGDGTTWRSASHDAAYAFPRSRRGWVRGSSSQVSVRLPAVPEKPPPAYFTIARRRTLLGILANRVGFTPRSALAPALVMHARAPFKLRKCSRHP